MPMVGEDWIDEDDEDDFESHYRATEQRHLKLLRRLRRKLPPKILRALENEFGAHWCMLIGIVGLSDVKGRRMRGRDFVGASTPIRHVFANISGCSYSETYAGDVYLYIGTGRYLQVQVSG